MSLEPGASFGSYEVVEPIGSGGMGEVWRATDTTLKRDVALKVLPRAFVDDANRLSRFRHEAEILASLNHPNIATIHGLEQSDDQTVIVMELVDGQTLAERIERGPVSLDETMGIALQIIAALEAAHGKGIVHRDLKPANVKVRDDGTVKVLDFGISKSVDPGGVGGVTPSSIPATTQTGVILGTAAYMSPEQARGTLVDQRSDIWAFGCVLYEMLTGQLAFGGDDSATTLARVLECEVDLASLPGIVSVAVRKTIELCLQKDVRKRIADIRDVRLMLAGSVVPNDHPGPAASTGIRKPLMIAAASLVLGAIMAGIWPFSFRSAPTPSPVSIFDWDIPEDQSLRATGRTVMAFSADGRNVVYNTADGLRLRSLDSLDASMIAGTDQPITAPVFSPDGQALAYFDFADYQIKRVDVPRGAPVSLATFGSLPYGVSWHDDGTILVGQADGVYRIPDTGGVPERIIEIGPDELLYGPQLLPDGDSVLFTATTDPLDWDNAQVYVQSLSSESRTAIFDARGSDVRYLSSGYLLYAVRDVLFARAFDLEGLAVTSVAVPVAQGLMRSTASITAAANYGVSDTGMLAWMSGRQALQMQRLVWVDRNGNETPTGLEPGTYTSVRLSPDDSRVALDTFGAELDIWTSDLSPSSLRKVTRGRTMNTAPLWMPNGDRLIWSRAQTSAAQEVFWQSADGSGAPERLTVGSRPVVPTDISADGEFLLYSQYLEPRDVLMAPMADAPSTGLSLFATDADETNATISPDAKWLAYQSDETGQDEIWVVPFPDVDSSRVQVSRGGGTRPVWSDDGTELFYYVRRGDSGTFMSVSYDADTGFDDVVPVEIFSGPYVPPVGLAAASNSFYDVSRDGQRFLIIRSASESSVQPAYEELPRIVFVENWFVDLERRFLGN